MMTNPMNQIRDDTESIKAALGGLPDVVTNVPFINPLNQIRDDVAVIAELVEQGGGGGTIEDGSITTDKLADGAVTADKIAEGVIPSGGGGSVNPQYGTCSTAASTSAKDVVCEGFELTTGARIVVKFTNANSQPSPSLNVNNTGAKVIYSNGSTVSSSSNNLRWTAKTILSFVYDGTYWCLEDKATCIFANSSTAESTSSKEASTVSGVPIINGTIVNVLFSTANTSETRLKLDVGGSGSNNVYYKGAETSASNKLLWNANSILTFVRSSAYWYCIAIDTA